MTASTDRDRMMKLMAYADGELEGAERAEIEKLIATDAEAANVVNAMLGLGDFVRMGDEDKVAPIVASRAGVDLTAAIMKAVENEKIEPAKPVRSGSNVSSLDAARAKKRNVGVAVAAALALAASVFVMTRDKQEEKPMAVKTAPTQVESPAANVNATASAGVEVEAVESPGHSVSVFYLPTANELSTSVTVWVDETGENK